MLRRVLLSLFTLFFVAAGSLSLTSAPAQADGSLAGDGGTLFEGCSNYRYYYDVYLPGASEWEMDLSVYAPDGSYSTSEYLYGSGDGESGTGNFFICGYEGTGWYSMVGEVTYYDSDYYVIGSETLDGQFRLVKQRTRTTMTVSDRTPRFNSVVKLVATSHVERPARFVRNGYEYVALEVRCGRAPWERVRNSKQFTSNNGNAVWRYRWNIRRTCHLRAVTVATSGSLSSASNGKKVNPVGRGRSVARGIPVPGIF